jgi:hypothetical protein
VRNVIAALCAFFISAPALALVPVVHSLECSEHSRENGHTLLSFEGDAGGGQRITIANTSPLVFSSAHKMEIVSVEKLGELTTFQLKSSLTEEPVNLLVTASESSVLSTASEGEAGLRMQCREEIRE